MSTRKQTTDNGSEATGFGRFAEDVSDLGGRAREFASDVADGAVRGGKRAAQFVVREVKEHPIRTLAIGAAVGIAVAAFFMLRNRGEE